MPTLDIPSPADIARLATEAATGCEPRFRQKECKFPSGGDLLGGLD